MAKKKNKGLSPFLWGIGSEKQKQIQQIQVYSLVLIFNPLKGYSKDLLFCYFFFYFTKKKKAISDILKFLCERLCNFLNNQNARTWVRFS